MATKATTFLSLAKIKEYFPIANANTARDLILERIADGVTERIERLTGRTFVNRSITEKLDAKGKGNAFLRTLPVSAVTQIRIRADLQSGWETLSSLEYELDDVIGQVHLIGRTFYAGPLTTEIAYTAGYGAQDAGTLPSDAVQCFLDYVTFCLKRQENGMIMAGSQSFSGGGSITLVPEPPKDLRDAIMNLRKIRGIGLG